MTLEQLRYVARATGVMLADPISGVERVRGRIDRRGDTRALRTTGLSIEKLYPVDPDWLRHLHEEMRWPWPCPTLPEGERLHAEVMAMFAAKGLPEHYHGWWDGGESFTKAAWCLTTHLKPRTVVETGVGRGLTSRMILEALARNGAGRLFSVDLPAVDSNFHSQIAIAVPGHLRHGWTMISGTSRRRLPGLLADLGAIDLFVHDSLHTGRNTRFEIDHAWQRLSPSGALLVDDVYQNLAFRTFVDMTKLRWSAIGANSNGGYPFGIAIPTNQAARSQSLRTTVAESPSFEAEHCGTHGGAMPVRRGSPQRGR